VFGSTRLLEHDAAVLLGHDLALQEKRSVDVARKSGSIFFRALFARESRTLNANQPLSHRITFT
jgi:hypothetical protein